jgi:hypothetical protein
MAFADFGVDGLLATTLKHYIPKLEDNVFTSKPLLWSFKNAGRIKNFHGEKLVQPLIYGESVNHGSYADDDVFATAAQTGIGAAEFDWKQYYGLVYFTGIELKKNSGKAKLLSLMEARLEQVEMTIAENVNEMLFGDGTGNSGKDFMGLAGLVNSATNTIGGIDRSAQAFWVPQRVDENGSLTLASMRTTYNDCSEGIDQPSNIFTTQSAYEDYEGLLQTNVRHESVKMGDAGFQNLMYKGAPMVFDSYCDTGLMYFINFKYITLGKLDDTWFEPSDLAKPTNQDVWYKNLILYGNTSISNSSRQGVLFGIT